MLKPEFICPTIVIIQPFNILPYITTLEHFGVKTCISCILSSSSSNSNIPDGIFWICVMKFSFKVWNYEFMNLSISGNYCEFPLKGFYVSWEFAEKRHKSHLLNPWHLSPQHLPPTTSSPRIELGKKRRNIRIIARIAL